ncbi:hypothetical protein BDV28DRAFT_163312 [Aspergillus coremiiformis]|uniref:BTB domain-containing protein n=1 Tax=Aspergillus coremiiformis TaxID=138285 RepID=A0A5N6YYZ7_9EURO|nr:hypothetical protein BDV28DRAFT_163312 [Aspergillus coremiiformis]
MDENKPATHVIDPEGEVMLVLQNPNAPFAVWEGDSESKKDDTLQKQEFRILVSAKHLTFVSPVFKYALEGNWKEGNVVRAGRVVEITADGWDLEALLMLLKICHCQHHQIPRTISLELLAKILVLADCYQCFDTLRYFTDTWIGDLEKTTFPEQYSRDVLLGVWISWTLKVPTLFKQATVVAVWHAKHKITSIGLPISQKVIDHINRERRKLIGEIFSRLDKLEGDLIDAPRSYSFECRSIMLGNFIIQRHSKGTVPWLNVKWTNLFGGLDLGTLL